MCLDCGCSAANKKASVFRTRSNQNGGVGELTFHPVEEKGSSPPANDESNQPGHTLILGDKVLAKNEEIAARNQKWFSDREIRVLNMISSPGSGKTMLLEKTTELLRTRGGAMKVAILTGDQERDFDERRLASRGAKVKQINTISSCHLDAAMIERELGGFVTSDTGLLIIENVGNLVCPAAFDLGETEKVALLSTTEGEDKPGKYPLLFHRASVVVITKTDLIPHLDWSLGKCEEHIRKVNPSVPIIKLSARTGEGMEEWLDFVAGAAAKKPFAEGTPASI